ncbi:hypothetical protein [Aquihabitans sp. McL0605]|uniref:hypothetical protein n=1 Tax=Aquihabitans sp. McL0605 TaxID=3415671 RepID=UPI003CF89AE8
MNTQRTLDATAFAIDIAAQVHTITGVEVHTWSLLYGGPINSVAWTATVESHAEMGAIGEKLMADPGYVTRIGESAELFESAPEDALTEVVATVNESPTLGEYASVVTAQCAEGKIADAMGFGVDILNHVAKVTGLPSMLTRSLYGPWASMSWITLASSLDAVDAANAAMGADPEYIQKVDGSAGLFLPNSGSSILSQRIA